MGAAFAWGAAAASSLIIGALFAFWVPMSYRLIGLIMAFGSGALISAVAFDLVEDATQVATSWGWAAVGLFAGCLAFFGGDWLIGHFGGGFRKNKTGKQSTGSSLAIVLGTVLDGIPESAVIGLTIFYGGEVGLAYLAAVFLSNLPESVSSTTGLVASGWPRAHVLWMWIGIAGVSALSSLAGFVLFQNALPDTVAFVLSFAAGAILTMLADTMMPEALEHGGKLVGIVTVLGFAAAYGLHLVAATPAAP